MTTTDRELAHGARVTLQVLTRCRPRHEHGQTVHRAGRALLANRLRRTQRQVSRYTAELERTGRIVKIPPRRMFDRDKGKWVCIEVQGYVIVKHKPPAHTGLTPVSPHPLQGRGSRYHKSRPPRELQTHRRADCAECGQPYRVPIDQALGPAQRACTVCGVALILVAPANVWS